MTVDILTGHVRAASLNPETDGSAILQSLVRRSPFATPVHPSVWVTRGLYTHLSKHQAGDVRRRLMRANWLEPTVTAPQEVRHNAPANTRIVYLACFGGHLAHNKDMSEVLAAIVDDREAPDHYSVITMFPLARPRDLAKIRKEAQLWP